MHNTLTGDILLVIYENYVIKLKWYRYDEIYQSLQTVVILVFCSWANNVHMYGMTEVLYNNVLRRPTNFKVKLEIKL